jgi:cupin 2 domain-containing protein
METPEVSFSPFLSIKMPINPKNEQGLYKMMIPGNFFSNSPRQLTDEVFEDIINTKTVKIERIISRGHASPQNFWYDQDQNEWVMVLKGLAGLKFEACDEVIVMKPGNYINIPARCKHRVEWTDPDEETVWLAVYY